MALLTVMSTTEQYCPTCGDERAFEQPPCPDGHGPDCPEWLCIDCGYAVMVEFDMHVETAERVAWAA